MNRMVCEDCGTVYYSAAARTMVERGERCPKCGGRLVLGNGPRPLRDRGALRGTRGAGGGDDPPGASAA